MTDDAPEGTLARALDLALCIEQDASNYRTVRDLVQTLRGLMAKEQTE